MMAKKEEKKPEDRPGTPEEWKRFEDLTRKILNVEKKSIGKQHGAGEKPKDEGCGEEKPKKK